jgi:hypothetical protein
MTLLCGHIFFHQDWLNNLRWLQEHISFGLVFIDNWSKYLSPESLRKFEKLKIPFQNTNFTVLCYTRAINGSQSDKLAGIANQTCPLFKLCVDIITNKTYQADYGQLEDKTFREQFLHMILHNKEQAHSTFDYSGMIVKIKEGTNRFIFLGAIAHVWELFKDKYLGHVRYHHIDVMVAFCMRECNGTPLIVDVMIELLETTKHETNLIEVLQGTPDEFYVYLSGVYQQ